MKTPPAFDAFSWQILETKQKFISQIMTSKSPVRSAEDVDDVALDYMDIKASYDRAFGTLSSRIALSIAEEYGVERTACLLAVTIGDKLWDGRLSMENRAWAVGAGAHFQDLDYAMLYKTFSNTRLYCKKIKLEM